MPLGLQVRVGTRLAVAGERVREHILTQVTASGQPSVSGQRLPVNVSLVIDRSGSMEGDPLEYVKRACAHVVDLLQPTDVLSIVTFEENVEVLMPARHVTDPASSSSTSRASCRATRPTCSTGCTRAARRPERAP
jgi:Ca-activated chloride channel family protein